MTEGELGRLLDAACRRPLLDALTVRRGKRKGEAVAELREETRTRLELLGRERALIYKTYLLTGLRKSELATLSAAQLELEELLMRCRRCLLTGDRELNESPQRQRAPTIRRLAGLHQRLHQLLTNRANCCPLWTIRTTAQPKTNPMARTL